MKFCDKPFNNGVSTERFQFLATNQFCPGECTPKNTTKQSPAIAYKIVQIFGASGLEFFNLKLLLWFPNILLLVLWSVLLMDWRYAGHEKLNTWWRLNCYPLIIPTLLPIQWLSYCSQNYAGILLAADLTFAQAMPQLWNVSLVTSFPIIRFLIALQSKNRPTNV